MNKSPMPKVLLLLLSFAAVLSVWWCWNYRNRIDELRRIQVWLGQTQLQQQVFAALVNEAVEYSKRNPAIDPILQSLGAKPASGQAGSTNRPAGK
jgi:hypothetical protein